MKILFTKPLLPRPAGQNQSDLSLRRELIQSFISRSVANPVDRPSYDEMRIESVVVGRVVREPSRGVPLAEILEQFKGEAERVERAVSRLEDEGLVRIDRDAAYPGPLICVGHRSP